MLSGKDYENMPLEQLVAEEKKLKSRKITASVFIGFMFGVAIYGAVHGLFLIPVLLMILAFKIGHSDAQYRKNIREELERRGAVPQE
ncbi:MAG: hypothetical protein MRY78_14930 [Saprospiraceae bacterium]|nr:hypothetical protein [Saprospiraceae bacterium]